MYCAVFLLADGTYERQFIDELPDTFEIREMEDEHSVYIKVDNRSYYNDMERKPAKIINLFQIAGGLEDE